MKQRMELLGRRLGSEEPSVDHGSSRLAGIKVDSQVFETSRDGSFPDMVLSQSMARIRYRLG